MSCTHKELIETEVQGQTHFFRCNNCEEEIEKNEGELDEFLASREVIRDETVEDDEEEEEDEEEDKED